MRRPSTDLGIFASALLTAVLACAPTAGAQEVPVRYRDLVFDDVAVTSDLIYGQAVNVRGELETLRLDIHEPAGDLEPLRAAVVWVHGGYFVRGDKTSYPEYIRQLARAGYVVASIDYRLQIEGEFPESAGQVVMELRIDEYVDAVTDAQHDAQAAIRWVRAHAAELRVDPELVAIAGHSAGGLTSTSVAFNSEDSGDSGNPGWSSRPAAVVVHAGGGLHGKTAHVDTGEPPILFVHGLADQIVPYFAVLSPCATTIAMLNVCEQVLDPDQGHPIFGEAQAREFLYRWMINRPPLHVPTALTVVGFP